MIKVGVIGHKEIPSYNGGIEAVLTEMIPLFDKNEFQITIYNRWVNFYNPKEWFKKTEYAGCKIVRIPTFRKSFLNAFVYSVLSSIHAMFSNYDIVHYHAEGPSALSFLPKLMGKKIVCTNHGLDWNRSKWGGFATKYLQFGEKMSVKTSDKMIVLNKPIAEYFSTTYEKDVVIIGNGINLNNNIPANEITDMFNLHKDEYFLALGRLVPEKGFHYLIQSYINLNTHKKLVIAGQITSSEYCTYLKKLAEDNENIIFTDFVDGTIKQELFSNCYTYVIPSDLEGMSISLLEALGYGCRVIASDIEENKNICDEHVLFFKKGCVESLTDVLKTVEPFCEMEKEYQITLIKNQFNWAEVVKKTANLYKGVMFDETKN